MNRNTLKEKVAIDYWSKKTKDKEIYNFEHLESFNTVFFKLSTKDLSAFTKITSENEVAEYVVLLSVFGALVQRYFNDCPFVFSKCSSISEDASLLYSIEPIGEMALKQYLQLIKEEVRQVYKNASFGGFKDKVEGNALENYSPFALFYTDKKYDRYNLPFIFHIEKQEKEFIFNLTHAVDFVTSSVAGHFLENYKNWITKIESYLTNPVVSISLLSEEEKAHLLKEYSQGLRKATNSSTLVAMFEQQVLKAPDHDVLAVDDDIFSYHEINVRANQLAHYLISKYNIRPDARIGIKLERNEYMIIAILAVLKSGAAYVPLDINYPEERLKYIEEDSQCAAIIDEALLETFETEKQAWSHENPVKRNTSNDLAYIIYTSGSTGNPKGVMITHGNATEFIEWAQEEFDPSQFDCVYASTSHCFDLSVFEMFYPLTTGIKFRLLKNALQIAEYLAVESRVLLNTVPSVTRKLLEESYSVIPNISVLNMAGEVLPVDIIKKLPLGSMTVRNLYGPSEDTTYSTCYKILDINYTNIPIGKPINNSNTYILDEKLELVPVGVTGKLYMSGAGVSKGYLNRPELTSEKFVDNPFSKGERMYDTGDLARWLPDGNIEFLGRKDNQIKLNGYRIELGEIEYAIAKFTQDIKQIVVDVKNVNGLQKLIAYYEASKHFDTAVIREHLQKKLPTYLVPHHFVKLNAIPLTPNGKVDRKALAAMDVMNVSDKKYIAPRTEIEKEIAAIWEDILGITPISAMDDFFELGGHSLLLTKLNNEYHRAFQAVLDLQKVYKNTTLAEHANLLSSSVKITNHQIEKVKEHDYYEVSPSQMRFWLLHKIRGKTKEFNIYSTLELPVELNFEAFEETFNELLKRHEVLRTVFIEKEGIPYQQILPHTQVSLPSFEWNHQSEVENAVFSHEFDLETFPLYKVALVKGRDKCFLFFNMHHSISDGWSIGIIRKELMEIYYAKVFNREPQLSILEISYKDYAHWQNHALGSELLVLQEKYWTNKLNGSLPYLQLPLDYPRKSQSRVNTSAFCTVYLNEELKNGINKLCKENRLSVFSFFVASLNVLLNRLTAERDIIIGIPVANRNHYQVKDVVGCFLNTLMLRNALEPHMPFIEFLTNVSQNLMEALAKQNYPFEQLLNQLEVPKETNRFPLSSVFVNMLDFEAKSHEHIVEFKPKNGHIEATPKFDFESYFKSYANGYELKCVYDTTLFKAESIEYWVNEYVLLVHQIVEDPARLIEELEIFQKYLPQEQDPSPNNDFNYFDDEEISQSIISRFEKQVIRTPDNIAIESFNQTLTYKELNTIANHLGSEIQEKIGGTAKRVALLLKHDESSVVGMLGVLKSGNSYVPIDADAPIGRLEYILQDSNSSVIICTPDTSKNLENLKQNFPELQVITFSTEKVSSKTANLNVPINPLDEAYVLYTSGSTGNPKGVIQNHRNVLHYIRVYTNGIHISAKDNLSLFSTYTFDASVKDIYGALLNGSILSIYNIIERGLHNLSDWLDDQGITVIHMVPTVYRHFMRLLDDGYKLETVRILDLGGEPCTTNDFHQFQRHFKNNALLINDYGPTEATIVSQKFMSHDSQLTANAVSIGKPVYNTDVFLLNEKGEKCGIYEEGEIVFKSDYLSLGYLNQEELTKRAFISKEKYGGRIYKSGDIGKLQPNGEIVFIKRKDTQIKLNGVRIELTEIENQLERLPEIEEAVVMLRELNENTYLVAYLRKCIPVEVRYIKSTLSQHLPKIMIPTIFLFLNEFPLTRTGKVDRNKLPMPELSNITKETYVAPENEVEEKMVTLWAEALNMPSTDISVVDNFFELGGNSLQVMILINKVNKEFDTTLALENFYHSLSVKELSNFINFSIRQRQEKEHLSQDSDEIII